ncbi:MAG: 3-oxoacyl-ACP reductase [Solirubrobacteraceae bacterium]
MADRYARIVGSPILGAIAKPLGLPVPVTLERHRPDGPLIDGTVLVGAAPDGTLGDAVARVLQDAEVIVSSHMEPGGAKGLVFDASGIADSRGLVELQRFFHPHVTHLQRCGRVIVLAANPSETTPPTARIAQRALEGFTRSLGKELGGRGITVQLVYVAPDAHDELASTLRFLLSPRSAFVSGQVVNVGAPVASTRAVVWSRPLHGKVALVTGAARGIGAAIAATLARDGAHVVGLDIPAAREELERRMVGLGGEPLTADITRSETPHLIAKRFTDGLDILVHNAGVTLDRTIAKMPEERWQRLMEINLTAPERITDTVIQHDLLASNGRVVCVSSMSGIAGNQGQTNYATSKAGVIGMVQAYAPLLAERKATITAVAPGFIETAMTDSMPFAIREAGRRMSSLRQGGLPVDVAETIAWLANPASTGLNGNTIRVCGQSLIGA